MSEMSKDMFISQMEAMRSHYKSENKTSYPLDANIIDSARNEDLPEAAKAENIKFQTELEEFEVHEQSHSTKKSEKLFQDKDYEAFVKSMKEEKEQAKKIAIDKLDAYFDKMIEIGAENPASRNIILKVVNKVTSFFNHLIDLLIEFAGKLIENILKWAAAAFEKINEFFNGSIARIGDFFINILFVEENSPQYAVNH